MFQLFFQGTDGVKEAFEFINPIHRIVQLQIGRQLSQAGRNNNIECQMDGIRPDVCSPPGHNGVDYRHAEVKPSENWVMATSTAGFAERQLARRDEFLNRRYGTTMGSQRAVAGVLGWPGAGGQIFVYNVGPLRIEWRYLSPGLYIYQTNFAQLALTLVAARALSRLLAQQSNRNWSSWFDDRNTRFPKPADPIARFFAGVAVGIVVIVVVVLAPEIVVYVAGAAADIAAAGGALVLATATGITPNILVMRGG